MASACLALVVVAFVVSGCEGSECDSSRDGRCEGSTAVNCGDDGEATRRSCDGRCEVVDNQRARDEYGLGADETSAGSKTAVCVGNDGEPSDATDRDVDESDVGDGGEGEEDGDSGADDARDGGGDTSDSGTNDAGDPVACEAVELPSLTAEPIGGGASFDEPVFVTQAPGESETLLVVERKGVIQRVRGGEVLDEPFLDIEEEVDSASHQERGLLGLAFHPNYQENGRYFIDYTPAGDTDYNVVAEYERNEAGADTERRRLVEQVDNQGNHNGGMIAFGPDGYLYVAMGDGGGADDRGSQHAENGNGQAVDNLFGAILRLDVDAPDRNFAAPGNPFVGESGKDQIWVYGLRNVWRFAFDPATGDLYMGDVGQDAFEEIDFQPASSDGGENYGWPGYEGRHEFRSDVADTIDDHVEPIVEIPHRSQDATVRGACSVTGGYVYRGEAIPALRGYYLYGDYCGTDVAALRYCDGEKVDHTRLPGLEGVGGNNLASFGTDNAGELYLVYLDTGRVLRITRE